MDIDGFWRLIERSGHGRDSPEERDAWLVGVLRRLDRVEIEDFEIRLQECRDRIDNAGTWAAADLLYDGCSTDGFWYFQCWLIGQGRDAFERAVTDPDTLAALPSVRRLAGRTTREWDDAEWPWWETLAYDAASAYPADESLEDALAARGFRRRCDPWPPVWSRAGALPRLRELFPAGAGRG